MTDPTEVRIDALRRAIDASIGDLNIAWDETKDPWGAANERLTHAITRLQRAATNDDIANGRDWSDPTPDTAP